MFMCRRWEAFLKLIEYFCTPRSPFTLSLLFQEAAMMHPQPPYKSIKVRTPLWTATTRRDEAARHRMTDDRGTAPHVLEEPRMRGEGERLRTFESWSADAPVTCGALAKAGFFFLGPGDKVQCFCCGGILRCWVRGDSPAVEHERHFPTCGFTLGRAVGNIPLQVGSSDSVDGQLLSQLQRMTMDDQGTAGQAVYPEMEAEDSRLTTFHNWPTEASVQPDILARAGFFYTGHGDNVKCFHCDGGLRNWEPGDDPWQEHAKWFPRCEFLIQERGQDYISNIQDSHFHLGDTVGGSQTSTGRDIGSRNDVVGGLGASSAMLSPVVQTVLQMGFEAGLVESLVQTKYLLTGQHYTSVSDLVTDVLQAEQQDRQRGSQSREPDTRQGSSAANVRTQTPIREKAKDPSPEELLRQLQEERTCKVCMDKLVSIVFIPCGHLVVCGDCAASLRHCPICRAIIRGSVRAFMS
ncbi:LOW QUALITY PROTEIN: baculoviral IAP repeat-containing protein 7 [Anarrhichthys ocellatus]|uniref:LOW QUALITY PROTEIN: baculoviral IAP repeat-containing protein 7 n=1 Tax=Anarrhichthys ocellatus TaxID=433405 RepID=UPI0012EE167B|nr:LOW QUALITY PROTEIN: baculoviral IAP repeat-containing protein 7-like [Anarrhichthys ocellatus]